MNTATSRITTLMALGAMLAASRDMYGAESTPAEAVAAGDILPVAWLGMSAGWCIAGMVATTIRQASPSRAIRITQRACWGMAAGCAIAAVTLYWVV